MKPSVDGAQPSVRRAGFSASATVTSIRDTSSSSLIPHSRDSGTNP